MKNKETITELLVRLSFEVACEIEVNEAYYSAQEDITCHYPINLN